MENDNKHLDGSNSTLYMKFHKEMRSAQGMDIWNDRAFILYDSGMCSVYDLAQKNPQGLDLFELGSYNPGVPSKDYRNHANHCIFAGTHWKENPIPLLYVTIGSGIGADEDGFFYRCGVENITCQIDEEGQEHYHSELLQVISYQPEGIEEVPYEAPCWGCPAFFVDTDAGFLYMFSARYRTKRGCVPEGKQNAYIITKFLLPSLDAGKMVHLQPKDILDQFVVESDVLFTQGGAFYDGKIYYTFGCPKIDYPLHLLVFDLEKREMIAHVGNMDEAFAGEEIECCARYQGRLLCNTCDGSIFAIEDGLIPI